MVIADQEGVRLRGAAEYEADRIVRETLQLEVSSSFITCSKFNQPDTYHRRIFEITSAIQIVYN